jgi:FdhD protein
MTAFSLTTVEAVSAVSGERRLTRIENGTRRVRVDSVAAEEPLEIRVAGRPLAVTMRTPGHDFELAAGFLLTEGLVPGAGAIRAIHYCTGEGTPQEYNVVGVELAPGTPLPDPALARNFLTSSACGLCGKTSIEEVRVRARYDVACDPVRVRAEVLARLPDTLRAAQRGFERTGGLHAAGLFDAEGALVCLREDVGRHNAFDKVIGRAALDGGLPLAGHLILASGRASFELTQKALMAGIPVLASVSAPSTLAVELAASAGMTLVGFLRGPTMNVYAGEERVV